MKKMTIAIITAVLLLFAACTSIPEKGDSVSSGKKEAAIEMQDVAYKLKETSFFSDGYIESYKVYTYNEDMTVAREDLFDSFDEITESAVYEGAAEYEVKRSLFNKRGELQSWKKILKDAEGLISRVEMYNREDQLQTASEYIYDNQNRKVEWTVYDKDNISLSTTKYLYDNSLNTRIDIYDQAGKLVEYFELEYSGEKLVKKSHYNSAGKLKDAVVYELDGEFVIAEKHLRANGSTSLLIKILNDENGSPVKAEYYDGNGKLKDWIETEYEYVSESVKVWK